MNKTTEPSLGDLDGKGYIYCGDKYWVPVGYSEPVKRAKVSKRAIAAADRADRAWDKRKEHLSTPKSTSGIRPRGGKAGVGGGHWTGD